MTLSSPLPAVYQMHDLLRLPYCALSLNEYQTEDLVIDKAISVGLLKGGDPRRIHDILDRFQKLVGGKVIQFVIKYDTQWWI